MDSVAGQGVVELEVKLGGGWDCGAGAAQAYAGGCEATEDVG